MCNIFIHGQILTPEGEFAAGTTQGHGPKCYSKSPLLQNSGNPGSLGQSLDPRRLGDEGVLEPVKRRTAIELPSFIGFKVDIPAAYYSQ
ncbi:hypothetical protein V490_03880 [Pseudogymnoascus sp. VKM F-3557]|nr:hypothetical protein V490_03880 [Pseudogymnoascus sp. VKM F-3557]